MSDFKYLEGDFVEVRSETDRLERWIKASLSLKAIEPLMMVAVQTLGRLDIDLIEADSAGRRARGQLTDDPAAESIQLQRHIGLSWLWVLGAYEIVRSAEQRLKGESAALALKRRFERVRIPLAKFEVPKHFQSDWGLGWPVVNALTGGIAWGVGKGVFIERRELADELLDFLIGLHEKTTAAREPQPDGRTGA